MAAEGVSASFNLQNAVLSLIQAGETELLRLLHAVGLTHDVSGQPAWPFASRVATETLAIDAGLARQVAWVLGAVCLAVALATVALAHPRLRPYSAVAALFALLLAPWPARGLILTEANATSFHRSPTSFDAASISRGLTLYEAHCAACHGSDGNGEGPRAASLSVWPPRLSGELLWHRSEGDLFSAVRQGTKDRHGQQTMPGFSGALSDAEVWSVIDAMRALAAGASIRSEQSWSEPVRAPDALVHCDDGTPDRPVSAYRGQRLRIVAVGEGASAPAEDPRLVTLVLQSPARVAPVPGWSGCSLSGAAAWIAYVQVGGATSSEFSGAQLLVDRDGWLRAYGRPGKSDWSQDDFICRSNRASATGPKARDGLGALIAAIDADPVRTSTLGYAHTP